MSNFPESVDIYVDKTGADAIVSSDPNVAYDGIETTQGLIGALGKPQTWSTTLLTLIKRYKGGFHINVSGGAPVVSTGEIVLENTDATKWLYRNNTTDTTLAAANLDVGDLAATTYYIYATGKTIASTTPFLFSTDPAAPSGIGTAPYRKVGWFENASAAGMTATYYGDYEGAHRIINMVSFNSVIASSGVTLLPYDNSKPQITEGDLYLTAKYAPENANNELIIQITINLDTSSTQNVPIALFQDAGPDALAAWMRYITSGSIAPITVIHKMLAGTTATILFTVRAGVGSAGSVYCNLAAAGVKFDGIWCSNITITEVAKY